MSSRTRTHCPGCGSAYPPRVRKCPLCGRARDQMSDAEAAAQLAPPQAVAPPTPAKIQTPASYAAAPTAGPIPPAAPKSKAMWAIAGALAFVFVLFKIATRPSAPDKTPPAPVAYVPSAQEKAAAAKQSADDTKFWAAKEAKERGEVNQYNESQQSLADARADAAQSVQTTERVVYGTASSGGSRYHRVRGDDGAPKTQHVSGYTRKDGTYVPGYSRRGRN